MAKPAPSPVRGRGRGRGAGDGGRGQSRGGKRKGENIIELAKKFKFVAGDSQAGTFQPNRSYAAAQSQQSHSQQPRTYEKEWAAYYASLGYHTSASAQYSHHSQNQWQAGSSHARQ